MLNMNNLEFLLFLPLKSMKMYFGFAQLIKFDLVLGGSFLLCVAKCLPL